MGNRRDPPRIAYFSGLACGIDSLGSYLEQELVDLMKIPVDDVQRLPGLMNGHRLLEIGVTIKGITNGIDPDDFNPLDTEQTGIAAGFDVGAKTHQLTGKQRCKQELLDMLL